MQRYARMLGKGKILVGYQPSKLEVSKPRQEFLNRKVLEERMTRDMGTNGDFDLKLNVVNLNSNHINAGCAVLRPGHFPTFILPMYIIFCFLTSVQHLA